MTLHRLTSSFLMGWWVVYIMPVILTTGRNLGLAADAIQQGSLTNQALVIAYGLVGSVHLIRSLRMLKQPPVLKLVGLFSAYLLWCGVSILWSVDVALSIRRFAQVVLVFFGSLGFGIGYYGSMVRGSERFLRHVSWAALVFSLGLWIPRLLAGTVSLSTLVNPEWQLLDGSVVLGLDVLAMSILVAGHFLLQDRDHWPRWTIALGVFLSSLLLIRSRTFLALAILFAFGYWVKRSLVVRPMLTMGSLFLALSGIALTMTVGGNDLIYAFALRQGDIQQFVSLTGRVPLWSELFNYLSHRWLTGYGFGAFWNVDTMLNVWSAVKWPAVHAHNGFLDELLGTGVIGLGLFLAFWLKGTLSLSHSVNQKSVSVAQVVRSWMVLFLLLNLTGSLLQRYFHFAFGASVIGLFSAIACNLTPEPSATDQSRAV